VKYRKVNSLITHKIKDVKGDGFCEPNTSRFFILEDETRIEIPVADCMFTFGKERWHMIKDRMDQEAGQAVRIQSR
ncbi:MAG: hypothetical protein ACHQRM_18200, partial [Bacteroidia bacterium]